jgi:hypothetical protein
MVATAESRNGRVRSDAKNWREEVMATSIGNDGREADDLWRDDATRDEMPESSNRGHWDGLHYRRSRQPGRIVWPGAGMAMLWLAAGFAAIGGVVLAN